jgi:DNA-binding NarL/FixJ family response regulator
MGTQDPEAVAAGLSVLIADDHPIVRMGLVGMVAAQAGLRVAAEAADGDEAVALYLLHRPDVVLMDLRMPGCDGVTAIERIRSHDAQARIVILTTFDGEEDIWRGLRAGAKAYLLKDSPGIEIVACIHAVARGQKYLPPGVAAKLAERVAGDELSQRELGVLRLLATGQSNKEIARVIGITEGTVKFHVTAVMAKLSAKSRTEAVATAVKRGLIDLQ